MRRPFHEEIAGQNRAAERPRLLTGLLIHPIAPDPYAHAVKWDERWSQEHAGALRFRIGGMEWFSGLTAVTGEKLADFSDDAIAEARKWGWPQRHGMTKAVALERAGHWGEFARNQCFEAIKVRPMVLIKAALSLLACELLLQSLVDDLPRPEADKPDEHAALREILSGAEVYRHMAIIPACWNVGGFNKAYIENRVAADPLFLEKLSTHTGQALHNVFEDLAQGHTVTFGLAERIKSFCDPIRPLGQIRCREVDGLGKRGAVKNEDIAA